MKYGIKYKYYKNQKKSHKDGQRSYQKVTKYKDPKQLMQYCTTTKIWNEWMTNCVVRENSYFILSLPWKGFCFKLACCRLPSAGQSKKCRETPLVSRPFLSSPFQVVARPLFLSSPLSESLEQAMFKPSHCCGILVQLHTLL